VLDSHVTGRSQHPHVPAPTRVDGVFGNGRVNVAGVVCFRPGCRPQLFYRLLVCHGRKSEPKSLAWDDYRDLIVAVHQQLGTPLVWCWDNLT
jgi:hypothetical protein